jgi:M6 family metalloprotease-like protein
MFIASLACQITTPALAAVQVDLDLAPVSVSAANSQEEIVLGQISLLVIAVEFPDYERTYSIADITNRTINQLNAYYSKVSYEAVSIVGKVTDWIKLPFKLSAYGADNGPFIDSSSGGSIMPDTWKLLRDASPMVTEDIAAYDAVFVLHAGPGQESSGVPDDIWSVTYLDYSVETTHGTYKTFAIVPEFEARGFGTLGVYAHEFGHLLGLPDLYDRTREQVGPWDLMARGAWLGNPLGTSPAELTAWSRLKLDWLKREYVCEIDWNVQEQQIFDIRPLELAPTSGAFSAVIVRVGGDEYYLIEVRAHIDFDSSLPQEGVLITFIQREQFRGVVDAQPATATLNDAAWQSGTMFHHNIEQTSQTDQSESKNQRNHKLEVYIAVAAHTGDTYTITVSFQGPPLIITIPLPYGGSQKPALQIAMIALQLRRN